METKNLDLMEENKELTAEERREEENEFESVQQMAAGDLLDQVKIEKEKVSVSEKASSEESLKAQPSRSVQNWLGEESRSQYGAIEDPNLVLIAQSHRSGTPMTGRVTGIEPKRSGRPFDVAIVQVGEYKILIPTPWFVKPVRENASFSKEDLLRRMTLRRMNAEVNFIIDRYDEKAKVAIGNRLKAMEKLSKYYYLGKDSLGSYRVNEGQIVKGRVVAVIPGGIFVDVLGIEISIPNEELFYRRIYDARTKYTAGDVVDVKILSIDRLDSSEIKVKGSVKQTKENPKDKGIFRYEEGSLYQGEVANVSTDGVFVILGDDMDIFCKFPNHGKVPVRGSKVTVKVTVKDMEKKRLWGTIIHVAPLREG